MRPSCPRSGAPSAPTSLPPSADGSGCQAAPTQPRAAETSRGHHQRPQRCLIRRRRPRYPATAFTSPTERAGEPVLRALIAAPATRRLSWRVDGSSRAAGRHDPRNRGRDARSRTNGER